MGCPSAQELEQLLHGDVSREVEASHGAHLSACAPCRAALDQLAGGTHWIANAARTDDAGHSPASTILTETIRNLTTDPRTPSGVDSDEPLDFLQPTDAPGFIGKLGAYAIIEKIASGGMGIVLKARDPSLDRIVAIKVLAPALARMPVARARFVREARAAAAVVHEHVVSIHAVEEINGLPYIVMQFVNGRTLAQRLRATGPMQLEEILRIGAQAASGLAAAHAQGLIHRDIKPGNILLENSVERVTLTDFGLARTVDDTGLTRTGSVTGTPEYMAPEQAGNGPVDQRADLFSLGGVLYAMAAGQSPFHGDSTLAVIRRVCDEEPAPLRQINPSVPPWFGLIVARLLAKSPAARFQTAAEVEAVLTECLEAVRLEREPDLDRFGIPVSRAARAWAIIRARRAELALAAVVVALAVGAGWWVKPPPVADDWLDLGEEAVLAATPFTLLSAGEQPRGAFTNLQEAFAAARSGDIVELNVNGLFQPGGVVIHGKALTVRAATNCRPNWLHDTRAGPAIATDAPLVLEGIAWASRRTDEPLLERASWHGRARETMPLSGETFIQSSGAPFLAVQCEFATDWNSVAGRFGVAFVLLSNSPLGELRDCQFRSAWIKGVAWRMTAPGNGHLIISNCVSSCEDNLWIELAAGSTLDLRLSRVTHLQRVALVLARQDASAQLAVSARNSVFATRFVFEDERGPGAKPLNESIAWSEASNLYHVDNGFLDAPDYVPGTRRDALAQWNRYWRQEGSESAFGRLVLGGPATDGTAPRPGLGGFILRGFSLLDGPATAEDRVEDFGADIRTIGTDAALFTSWRQSPAYAEWRAHVARVLAVER